MKKFICDYSKIKDWKEFSDGRLLVPVTLTRTGIFNYRYEDIFGDEEHPEYPRSMFKDGIIKVYRSFEEVSKEKSLESMKGMFFTDEHPEEEVSGGNWKELSKGIFSTEIKISEKKYNSYSIHFFDSFVTVADPAIIKIIKDRIKEQISLGYTAGFIFKKGTFGGKTYDAEQVDIEHNHGALVVSGRAGSNVKIKTRIGDLQTIHTDIEEYVSDDNNLKSEEKEKFMIIRGKKITVDEMGELLISQELEEKDKEINALNDKVKVVDSLEAKVLKLEKDLKDSQSVNINDLVNERFEIIEKAKHFIKDKDLLNMSNQDLMKESVQSFYGEKDLSGRSEVFFKDSFELLEIPKDNEGSKPQRQSLKDSFSGAFQKENVKDDNNNSIGSLLSVLTSAYNGKGE